MAISKKEFSAVDAAPAVQYALTEPQSPVAVPVLATSDGELKVSDQASADSAVLLSTLQELVARLDALAACKHHLTEAVRVQIAGSTTLSVTNSVVLDGTGTSTYMTPAYAKFLHHMAWGNQAAIQSNIQNVVV